MFAIYITLLARLVPLHYIYITLPRWWISVIRQWLSRQWLDFADFVDFVNFAF